MAEIDYTHMLASQNGTCKLCGKPPRANKTLVLDRDSRTGEARGLLCGKCKQGLEMLGDDPLSLRRAFFYVSTKAAQTSAPPLYVVKTENGARAEKHKARESSHILERANARAYKRAQSRNARGDVDDV